MIPPGLWSQPALPVSVLGMDTDLEVSDDREEDADGLWAWGKGCGGDESIQNATVLRASSLGQMIHHLQGRQP